MHNIICYTAFPSVHSPVMCSLTKECKSDLQITLLITFCQSADQFLQITLLTLQFYQECRVQIKFCRSLC